MKKFLSLALVLAVVFGMFTMLCGINAFAEPSYTAEVWSPVEITLTSSVDYKNHYTDTEIDAVFTHADGTVIKLPGFWKEGKTWAVRFSPTKTGKWSYTITCKDASNTGLTSSGVIEAKETKKTTEIAKHGFVSVVPNQHYYTYADGTPFFWLADTNWQSFTNVSTEACNFPGCDCGDQFKHIVDDRVEKGFNVYQTYFVPGAGNGEKSVWAKNYSLPNTEVFNEKIDYMFKYLHEKGMAIALGLGCHNSTMSSGGWTDTVYLRFARYIVARYACYSLVWISGQEITNTEKSATEGKTVFECYFEMSSLIEELDGYKHPNSAHMYPAPATNELQVTLDKSDWHDSWTIQGGHGGVVKNKAMYMSYYIACGSGKFKPFIEAEVNYEDINCGGFTGYHASRRSAWKAILCGSAGFTYGVTGIWANCFSTSSFTGWFDGRGGSYNYEPWYIGLDKPGSYEMTYMKNFFEDIPQWYNLVPCFNNQMYGTFLKDETAVLSATPDASTVVGYFYNTKNTATGTVKNIDKTATYKAYWFNPLTGMYIKIAENITAADGTYKIPERPTPMDWAFVMTTGELGDHYEEEAFTDLNATYEQVAPTGTAVTPVAVTAIGGISYKGGKKAEQKMTDNTAYLYDGDPSTIWEPFADRTTQTFLFDLGTAQNLSGLTITPDDNTILPRYRIEGSNDLSLWTIITDTELRIDVENPGICSEPLKGAYRYVKVILLNAVTLNISEDEVKNQPYECFWNRETENAYSVTRIKDLAIYSTGEATEIKNPVYVGGTGAVIGNPNVPVVNGGNGSKLNTVIIYAVISLTAVVVVASAAYIVVTIKKAKKS